MPTYLYAHTPNEAGEWHLLDHHLHDVAELTAAFADKFGCCELGRYIGLLHDLGKASGEFQDYLRRCHTAKLHGEKLPHSSAEHKLAGAVSLSQLGGLFGLLAVPIIGHHGGMKSYSDTESSVINPREIDRVKPVVELTADLLSDIGHLPFPSQFVVSTLPCEMLLRMLYSCLVDADSLDTELHWEPEKTGVRRIGEPIPRLWSIFKENQSRLLESASDTLVNRVRREIYDACLESADSPKGIFKLTVPTGGGKTRSGMAFALKHAVKHGLHRVIVAIPYTSIIDQNAREYRNILGDQNVLEHHSAVNILESEDYSEDQLKMELAAENWDVPIVVTTTVQLFESLFSNKRSKCRKLHNLANSVIILDEVQTLPLALVQPILDVLKELVANYGVSLVLSTATQPAFTGSSPYLEGFPDCIEIVNDPGRHFDMLKRVEYTIENEPWPWTKAADEIRNRNQVLCVLNSRKDAVALFKLLDDPDAFHLSTLMCPAHRRDVLDEIRHRLDNALPCRVVSTQVVEAGVDLDFPCVMRAAGPLDRIVQAAGRCNREGKIDGFGEVIVFQPEEEKAPKGTYATAMAEAKRLLQMHDTDLHTPHVFDKYFTMLWQDCNLDAHEIGSLRRRLNYPEVAARFNMIDSDTVSVVTGYGDNTASAILEKAKWRGAVTREEWRILQAYSVSIYRYEFENYSRQGQVKEILPGLCVWQGTYNHHYGITDDLPDPADLIT